MVIAAKFPPPGTARVTDKYCSKTSQCIFRLMTQPEIEHQYNLFMHCTDFSVLHRKLCTLSYYINLLIILLQCPSSVSHVSSFHGVQMLVQQNLLTLLWLLRLARLCRSHCSNVMVRFDTTCSALLLNKSRTDQRVFLAGWSEQDCNTWFSPVNRTWNPFSSLTPLIFGPSSSVSWELVFFIYIFF